ncbi:putative phosphatidylglycerophosphate synthase [Bacillus sp. TS-2]|nr:putative phosphatidylglycerophosphate synthase [Bacillus sp. TS-2]
MEYIFNQDVTIILYCILIFWMRIGYIMDYRNIKEGLQSIESEEEIEVNTKSFTVTIMSLSFSILTSWILYILAYILYEHVWILYVLALVVVLDLYHSIHNKSFVNLRRSKLPLYRAVSDVTFTIFFLSYYLLTYF